MRCVTGDMDEEEEEAMDKAVFRRRRDAYKEAWRRSASKDTTSLDGPAPSAASALALPPTGRPAMPRIESTDFANDELMRRNEIFCGRL
jgi:hypothetical protein